MNFWIGFLWERKSWLIAGIVALTVGGYILVMKSEIHSLNNKVSDLQTNLATANAETAAAQATVARLNSAVQKLSDEGKMKSAHAKELQTKYEGSVKKWQDFVGGLTLWSPNPNEEECAAARRLLKESHK